MKSKDFYRFWNFIEARAFSPQGKEEIGKWLANFTLFLNKAFGKKERWVKIKPENNNFPHEFRFEPLKISCHYRIEMNLAKFSFFIEWNGTAMQIEYDSRYICEFDYLREHCNVSSNEFTQKQLEEVLRCKIWHPALHYHLIKPGFFAEKGKNHDIRIAAAARNPFLFLYQFSFQFLLIFGNKKKQQELNRLITIISENKNKKTIPPKILFGI